MHRRIRVMDEFTGAPSVRRHSPCAAPQAQARPGPGAARRRSRGLPVAALALVALTGCALGDAPDAQDRFACARAATATIERRGSDRLFYCGPLNPRDARRFARRLRPQDTTLEIVSYGGDLDGPLAIAERVEAQGMTVRVLGPCFSGCASFVFPAGRVRVVEPGGLLGFHNTATSVLEALAAWPVRLLSDDEQAPLKARAAREKALYARSGVSQDLLSDPLQKIRVTCLVRAGSHRHTAEPIVLIQTWWGLWSPSVEQLAAYGVAVTGGFPERTAHQKGSGGRNPTVAGPGSALLFGDQSGTAPGDELPAAPHQSCVSE